LYVQKQQKRLIISNLFCCFCVYGALLGVLSVMRIFIVLLLICRCCIVNAQEVTVLKVPQEPVRDVGLSNIADELINLVTIEKKNCSFFVFPQLSYEDRTGITYGIYPVVLSDLNSGKSDSLFNRTSSLSTSFAFSSTGMYQVQMKTGLYIRKWYLQNEFEFQGMPDRFFGVGNYSANNLYSEFDQSKMSLMGVFMYGLNSKCFIGVNYDWTRFGVDNIKGDVLSSNLIGNADGFIGGIGSALIYDARDDVTYTTKGLYWKLFTTSYLKGISDFNFFSYSLDVRSFFPVNKDKGKVFGVQGFLKGNLGDVPFYRLASLGGKDAFRGVSHPYRYLDNFSVYLQAVYRSDLWWRVGYEVFAGFGNVFDSWGDGVCKDVHVMTGVGIRFCALKKERLNIRIDYGLTNRGDNGVFFTVGEAF
jgi:hypothetical protein